MAKKIIKTDGYEDMVETCQGMGDKLATNFYSNNDYKQALAAASLYKASVTITKLLLFSKRQTGRPSHDIGGF